MIYMRLDPRPSKVPTRTDVLNMFHDNRENKTFDKINYTSREDYKNFVTPTSQVTKTIATYIVTSACNSGEKVCHAKALYEFVRDNIEYVSDPQGNEYVESNYELLFTGGGDCESGTLLLGSLLESVGVDAQMVFIPGHAFLRIKVNDAVNRYKIDGEWIYLDWTCRECEFGEIPWKNIEKEHSILEVP